MANEAISERTTSLWRNRDYLLLWLGQGVSSLGTGISQFAFPLLILALTNAPANAGFAGALEWFPYVLLSLPAGALIDRWNRKRVMLVSTLGLTLCMVSIPTALLLGHLTLLHIYLVSFAIGILALFYGLAELAALTHVVPKSQIPTAVAQNEAAYSTVSLLAPSFGGLLFNLGRMFPFVADVISYLILLGSLLGIRSSFQEERSEAPGHLFKEVREGIRWLWSQPVLRFLAFLMAYLYLVINGSVLIVLVIARQHQISSSIIGLILAAGGVGNLIGTTICTPLQRRLRFGWTLCSMLTLFVLLWPLYSLASTPIFLAVVVASLALIDSISAILIASYRLAAVPDELQGRVGSIYRLILYGSLALGQAGIGISLQFLGVWPTVGILWSGLIFFAGGILIDARVRRATFPDYPNTETL